MPFAFPRPAVILFDLDGTLIDSVTLIIESARYAFEARARTDFDEATWLADLGMPLATMFGRVTDDPEEVTRLIAAYREFQLAHHDELVTPYPGVSETLAALRDLGIRLGIVTSKTETIAERGLALVGIQHFFETIVGLTAVKQHKPHPEPVHTALSRMNVPADQAWFVGDSPHDMAAGNAAGVVTLGALWGPFSREQIAAAAPAGWLDRITELLRLVGAEEAPRPLSQFS